MRIILMLILHTLPTAYTFDSKTIKRSENEQPLNYLNYLRRKVEDLIEDTTSHNSSEDEESISNIVLDELNRIDTTGDPKESKISFTESHDDPTGLFFSNTRENNLDLPLRLKFRPTIHLTLRPLSTTSTIIDNETIFSDQTETTTINDITFTNIDSIYKFNYTDRVFVSLSTDDNFVIKTTIPITTDVIMETRKRTRLPSELIPRRTSMITHNYKFRDYLFGSDFKHFVPTRTSMATSSLRFLHKNISDYPINIREEIRKMEPRNQTISNYKSDLIFRTKTLSCVMCDNVQISECEAPQLFANKRMPVIDCSERDQICYAQHTPFGIVDRGCFNPNKNLTVYVCGFTMCNFRSITEMPVIFSTKQDWIVNVHELSQVRPSQRAITYRLTCIYCETKKDKTQFERDDHIADENCMEGRVDKLPKVTCKNNQMCAVKAIKGQGYVWRGCVDRPLYNYYITFCNNNMCNVETLISIFDSD